MAESTKIRPLSRLIDQSLSPIWVIGPDDTLVFLSAACEDWLGVRGDALIGRKCKAGTSLSDDPLDYLAASLAPPPGFEEKNIASLEVSPSLPGSHKQKFSSRPTRFLSVALEEGRFAFAISGEFSDETTEDQRVALQLRQALDRLSGSREQHAQLLGLGVSRASRRLQSQLNILSSVRADFVVDAAPGMDASRLGGLLHQRSTAGEPLVTVDGSLMDAELLDASLSSLFAHLDDSDKTLGTVMLDAFDEMPGEAQSRLVEHTKRYGSRLRLIAIVASRDSAAPTPIDTVSVHPALEDRFSALRVTLTPLSGRVEDIPLLATAALDRRRAAGESVADRFSEDAIDALVIYPWPRNIEELNEAIRQAARQCRSSVVQRDDLPLAIRSYRPNAEIPAAKLMIDLDAEVASFERGLIDRTLETVDGNRAEAARRLGISRARLLRKLDAEENE
ncbi:MAG: helix-turn-helix domain-containing protein [Planctomycetota bacterium]